MTTIAIPLSDERLAQLRQTAEEAGLPPEEFLRRHRPTCSALSIDDLLGESCYRQR